MLGCWRGKKAKRLVNCACLRSQAHLILGDSINILHWCWYPSLPQQYLQQGFLHCFRTGSVQGPWQPRGRDHLFNEILVHRSGRADGTELEILEWHHDELWISAFSNEMLSHTLNLRLSKLQRTCTRNQRHRKQAHSRSGKNLDRRWALGKEGLVYGKSFGFLTQA